ncbi:hypothetical protein IFM89_024924 [Coptis chinensis]|uniref:UBA domain-containing protein n=1 Tax=Coptis chinensis TaxID=261450 RepID=A0A835LNH6_9MAGN|nr:hypothetical protein IFM89_024924 [Coptis chinensis]
MNGGPSGFHNAPVTRAFVIASALLTILIGVRGSSSKLGLSYQDIFGRFRVWRLFASVFAFSSTPELMFGLYLLYYFRVFERQIGSNKYSAFILFSIVVSSLFEAVALAFFKDPSLNMLASGPYGLIFSSFVPFYFDIPISTRFRIFGINFSDKSFVYLAGLQLLFSSWKRSIMPGICGVLAGLLYRSNIFGVRRIKASSQLSSSSLNGETISVIQTILYRRSIESSCTQIQYFDNAANFPGFVSSFFSRLSWPTLGGSSPPASGGNVIGNTPSYTGREVQASTGNYPSVAPLASTVEPSDNSIGTLVSMGFDRNSARQALVQARNDVNVATNILLEAQSH